MSLFTRSRQLPDTARDEADADGGGATGEEVTEEATEETRAAERGTAERAEATGTAQAADTPEADGDSPRPGWFGWRRRYPRTARGVSVGTSVLAGLLVLLVLLFPNRLDHMNVRSFFRLPVEAIVIAAVLLVLPPKARRIAAVALGLFLGLFTVLKFMDMGFYQTLARPFDLVFDWIMLGNATDWLRETFGRTGEILAVIGVIVLFLALLALCTWAMVRLTNVMSRHRQTAVGTTLVLGTVWVTCFTVGVQFGGVSFATKGNTEFLANRVQHVRNGLGDAKVFEKESAVDAFAATLPTSS